MNRDGVKKFFKKSHVDSFLRLQQLISSPVSICAKLGSIKHNCEMTAFPLSGQKQQKSVFSPRIKSFQEAWQRIFEILAGLFPLQLQPSLSFKCHHFCGGLLSPLDRSV